MCYGFEVDLLRVDFGLFSNLRFFCSFLNQLHNSVLGVAAEGRGVALGGGGSFLHEIFLIWRSDPGLLHCRQILYHLSHQGSPGKVPTSYLLHTWQCTYINTNLPVHGNPLL